MNVERFQERLQHDTALALGSLQLENIRLNVLNQSITDALGKVRAELDELKKPADPPKAEE